MFLDPYAVKTGDEGDPFWGRIIPFLGAGCGALQGFLISGKGPQLHPLTKLAQYFSFGFIFQLIAFPYFMDNDLYYSFDPKWGAFGWLSNWDSIIMVMCVVSPLTGVLSNIGYFFSFNYFPMQIVAAAILTEPFIGQIGGILLGQDQIPGLMTGLGL